MTFFPSTTVCDKRFTDRFICPIFQFLPCQLGTRCRHCILQRIGVNRRFAGRVTSSMTDLEKHEMKISTLLFIWKKQISDNEKLPSMIVLCRKLCWKIHHELLYATLLGEIYTLKDDSRTPATFNTKSAVKLLSSRRCYSLLKKNVRQSWSKVPLS